MPATEARQGSALAASINLIERARTPWPPLLSFFFFFIYFF
jgi:hypothetical protein